MTRYVLIGVLLFLGFAAVLAPASLIRSLIPADSGIGLLQPAGTLWDGAADLYLAGQPAGHLQWNLNVTAIFRGVVGYDIALAGPEHALTGSVGIGIGGSEATLRGQTSGAFANRWLTPYDIHIGGSLELRDVHVRVPYDVRRTGQGAAAGSLAWSGGPVRYVLSGRSNAGSLPPLVAYLGEGLETVVVPEGGQTPLLRAKVLTDGFVSIGVTKLLTRLVGSPWPGTQADHEVVLEVEEQLF